MWRACKFPSCTFLIHSHHYYGDSNCLDELLAILCLWQTNLDIPEVVQSFIEFFKILFTYHGSLRVDWNFVSGKSGQGVLILNVVKPEMRRPSHLLAVPNYFCFISRRWPCLSCRLISNDSGGARGFSA